MGKALISAFAILLIAGVFPGSMLYAAAPLMVEKNLFAPDRHPPSDESSAPASATNKGVVPPKSIQLDGVVYFGDVKKALVRVKGQGAAGDDARKGSSPYMSVQEGEKVAGYTVTKIDSKSIIIEKDGHADEVRLFAEGKVSPPVQPMPVTAPAPEAPQAQPPPVAIRAPGLAHPGAIQPGTEPAQAMPGVPLQVQGVGTSQQQIGEQPGQPPAEPVQQEGQPGAFENMQQGTPVPPGPQG